MLSSRRMSSPLLLLWVCPLLLLSGSGTQLQAASLPCNKWQTPGKKKLTAILPVSFVAVLTVKFSRVPRFLLNAEHVAPKSWLDSRLNWRASNVSTHQSLWNALTYNEAPCNGC